VKSSKPPKDDDLGVIRFVTCCG